MRVYVDALNLGSLSAAKKVAGYNDFFQYNFWLLYCNEFGVCFVYLVLPQRNIIFVGGKTAINDVFLNFFAEFAILLFEVFFFVHGFHIEIFLADFKELVAHLQNLLV